MEYSVYDLVRILLKKWYIILLTVALVAGLSIVTARKSYEKVGEDYEQYTTETVSIGIETGTLVASYEYGYEINDLSRYTLPDETKTAFLEKFAEEFQSTSHGRDENNNVYSLAEQAFSKVSEDFSKQLAEASVKRLLSDASVMKDTQSAITAFQYQEPPTIDDSGTVVPSAGPLTVANHFAVDILDENTLRITVSGLEKNVAQQIIDTYLNCVASTGNQNYALNVTAAPLSADYSPAPVVYTSTAQFAQTVMQKPEQAPNMKKTAGTAAAYAFVLACFMVLLVTFIKDTRPSKKKNTQKAA